MTFSKSAEESGWRDYSAQTWDQRKPITWLDDWPFWAYCAEKYAQNMPILELACGNGRITRQLALAGYKIMALDLNPHFLNRAIDHLPAELRSQVDFVLQDVVNLDLPQTFSFVLMADWAFPAILSQSDQILFFQNLSNRLTIGGIFAFNTPFSTAQQHGLQASANGNYLEWPHQNRTYDPITQIETRPSDNYTLRFRHNSLGEIQLLAHLSGFEIIEQYGGIDRRPLRGIPGDDLTLILRKTS